MLKITWGEVLGSVKLGGGFQNHAGDYLGGGGEEGRPSSRTRSPHTLKLNSEWSADGSTYREGGGTLVVEALERSPDLFEVPTILDDHVKRTVISQQMLWIAYQLFAIGCI